jgi:uncharacterized protein (TIGR02145 family)
MRNTILLPIACGGAVLLFTGCDPVADVFPGCTDALALNYDAQATEDNGSCVYEMGPEGGEESACAPVFWDGHAYDVAQIGAQCWFAENLRTTVYLNGDAIPSGLTETEWSSTEETLLGAAAVYGEETGPCNNYSPEIEACDEAVALEAFGRLYNGYAVQDARGLCPNGWHIPTVEEWLELEDHVAGEGAPESKGFALKSTASWSGYTNSFGKFIDGNGGDDHGFSAMSAGFRFSNGAFGLSGMICRFWSATSTDAHSAYVLELGIHADNLAIQNAHAVTGLSVRCLRDAE